jgi:L-fuculose-phosphate aldolase
MSIIDEDKIREQICEIGKRVYDRGFVVANDGNISVKLGDDEILCTPTGVSKGFMTPDMICKINLKGEVLETNGKNRPSSEVKMHLRVYEERPDVNAVVHAHPPFGTAYAVMNKPLDKPLIPESVILLGEVPVAKYGTPSTEEIPDAISKYLQDYDAMLLENHGALTYSSDLEGAFFKMESLEFYAKITFICELLGDANVLNEEKVKALYSIRKQMNLPGRHPAFSIEEHK